MNTRNIDLLPQLSTAFAQEEWDELLSYLDPKLFNNSKSEEFIAFPVMAKVAEILTTEDVIVPMNVKIKCLRCLGNSCYKGYKHKEYISPNIEDRVCYQKLYSCLTTINENLIETEASNSYPFHSHFPYEGVIEWTSSFIASYKPDSVLSRQQPEIIRACIEVLSNLFTLAWKDSTFVWKDSAFPDQYNIPKCLYNSNLKNVVIKLTHSDDVLLASSACTFIYNAINEFEGRSYTDSEKIKLCSQLLRPTELGFQFAKKALYALLHLPNGLRNAYNDMAIEDRLSLLEIMYSEVSDFAYKNEGHIFTKDIIEFLSERFCRKSDLILKTVDTYLNEVEPQEIIMLLLILGTLTSTSSKEYNYLEEYKSLLINCTYLLKSIQMIGKESNNYFTPLQKLSDVAPAVQGMSTKNKVEANENGTSTEMNCLRDHPAYGFKAGLIRVIGNMSYKNKKCQDFLRELDAVPLLLDCCNIDARNPLIMQWAILGLRNLCEGNPANQEIIRNCTRAGVVENSVLLEMGLTLHEDEQGKKIGIVPLAPNQK